jgi:hypothetical protein
MEEQIMLPRISKGRDFPGALGLGYVIILMLFLLVAFTVTAAADAQDRQELMAQSKAALIRLRADHPDLRIYEQDGRITRLYRQPFGSGTDPVATAEAFRTNNALALGVNPEDLRPIGLLPDGANIQPVTYDPVTGTYKFTLVYYTQYKDGLPVYGGDLRLLIRNTAGSPLVLASSGLRDLRHLDFKAQAGNVSLDRVLSSFRDPDFPNMVNVRQPRAVIWAGTEETPATPTVAVEFTADNGEPVTERWHYVVDAASGQILFKENLIIEDVGPPPAYIFGNVSGMATQGVGAEQCELETPEALPYARVKTGTKVVYTDKNGNFAMPTKYGPVTLESRIWGRWFRVFNTGGTDAVLYQEATPLEDVYFLHNETNNDSERAQVNAYVEANVIRDLVLHYNPSYPALQQSAFPIYVNRTDAWFCPGNAWYDAGAVSMNFCKAGGSYPNTAFSTVVHHEYGHHLIQVAGSGQGQYGEGMADCMGILVTDHPETGVGFTGSCSTGIRTGENDLQYPCSLPNEIHYCGQLLSGCIWSTRNALTVTYPSTYRDILGNLTVNSILLHRGYTINPQITIDFLTLDDDDGNLDNGTPHSPEILAGFGAHNMGLPEGRNIWVDATLGNDTTGDGSETSPFKTINHGIGSANLFGDTVRVKPGTYAEQVNFNGKSVVVMSTNGPHETIIQGSGGQFLVNFNHHEDIWSVLQGFKLVGGARGVSCYEAGPTIRGNLLVGQSAFGIYIDNEWGEIPWIVPVIEDNTIVDGGNIGIYTCTLVGVPIRNTIIARNQTGMYKENFGGYFETANPVVTYCDVWGNTTNYVRVTPSTGTISADPLFTSDYTLYRGSPCIDAGDLSSAYNDPDGTRDDIGTMPVCQVDPVATNYHTIQSAIDVVRNGDVVLVRPGTYGESITFYGKRIIVTSRDGAATTIIDGQGVINRAVVYFNSGEPKGAELSYFTVRNGRYSGIFCDHSSPKVLGNIIEHNRSVGINDGGGIDLNYTTAALVKSNTVRYDTATTYGSAIHVEHSTDDTICYNLMYQNYGYTEVRCLYANTVIYNNTIDAAGSRSHGIANQLNNTSINCRNNIIINAPHYGIYAANAGRALAEYNCIYNCTSGDFGGDGVTIGTGNIHANPAFYAGTYNLSSTSPCIDAGDPDPFFNDPDGSRNDIGYQPYSFGLTKEVIAQTDILPSTYTLAPNYPNPFNPTTTIEFTLPQPGHVDLSVYNLLGQKVRTLVNEELVAGTHQVVWDARNDANQEVAGGVYFYLITAGDFHKSQKMVLLK